MLRCMCIVFGRCHCATYVPSFQLGVNIKYDHNLGWWGLAKCGHCLVTSKGQGTSGRAGYFLPDLDVFLMGTGLIEIGNQGFGNSA